MPHAQTSNTTEQDICAARGAGRGPSAKGTRLLCKYIRLFYIIFVLSVFSYDLF